MVNGNRTVHTLPSSGLALGQSPKANVSPLQNSLIYAYGYQLACAFSSVYQLCVLPRARLRFFGSRRRHNNH